MDLDDLLPRDRRRRYDRIQLLKCGLSFPVVLATYSPGSNVGSLHWLWRTDATDISSAINACQPVSKHTNLSHSYDGKATFEKFGLISKNVKKSVLRHFYRDLTGDQAVTTSWSEKEVHERLCALFELEEPDLFFDLRYANQRKQK